jgi:phosphohistidine phosphatase
VLLYLVRHAIAFDRDPQAWPDDRERPLTPEGRQRFRRAARGLRALGVQPDAVFSSRYVRAWQTAEVLVAEAGWPVPQALPVLESDHPPAEVLSALRTAGGARSLALVGHEPQMHALAALLLAGAGPEPEEDRVLVEFRKGGVACLRLDGSPASGRGTLVWHATPKLLRAAG